MSAAAGTVAAPAAFDAAPNVSLEFEPDTLVFRVAAGLCDISFDGVNVHLILANTDPNLVIPSKRKKMWFKQNGGATTIRWSALTLA